MNALMKPNKPNERTVYSNRIRSNLNLKEIRFRGGYSSATTRVHGRISRRLLGGYQSDKGNSKRKRFVLAPERSAGRQLKPWTEKGQLISRSHVRL